MDARRSDTFAPATPLPAATGAPSLPHSTAPVPVAPTPVPVKAKRGRARVVLPLILLAALGGGGSYGWHWWTVGRFHQTTDDAYLQADKVTVAPKVGGLVATVAVGDNQPVHAGDVLATVDDRDYRNALAQAEAEVEKGEAQLAGYAAAVIQQVAQVETSKADVSNAEAALTFAQQEAKRYQELLSTGSGTSQRAQQTQSDLLQKQAAVTKTRAALDASQKQVATFEALERSARATIAGARAKVEKARLDIDYTAIRAPIDGVVGDRSVRPGQYVQPGTALLTVVPMGRGLYLVANFKETQIGHMVRGQPVTFTVDAFGDHPFHGTVESFAPGTGSQFALLPPENATGNFTKVVQRVPVRIKLADDPLLPRLRPGLSVEATVETKGDDMDGDGRTRLSLAAP
ncbi:HlyD family secretion protein [Methylobacterium aerolatum]|uniref:Membrane fusion protein (Multidrug efflux system) n=1 Tax=Methylobacterium aerolatum TaxID=418708 RepID=A0ABU0HUP4_9HYPH|nr:HlyD family secretion protein [Methylobacterium aerolatum]MDQ0446047.1 membrane fusion protein (multidrug efflux system) [Methylobacterium aerolatum]GJD35083.1 Colistin resistance protein EmrA [Methylobacterium aerolatum]